MDRQHHQLNEHESEQTLGGSEEQGSLVHCSPWVHRVGHDLATEQQQPRENNIPLFPCWYQPQKVNEAKFSPITFGV